METVIFEKDYLAFEPGYELAYSQVRSTNLLYCSDIVFIAIDGYKNKVVTKTEVVFVDRDYAEQLVSFAERNAIPAKKFYDVWEDFAVVDSLEDPEARSRLHELGFTDSDIEYILKRFKGNLKATDAYGEINLYQIIMASFRFSKSDYDEIMQITLKALKHI